MPLLSAELTTNLEHAAALLKSGGLVAFATETVYGLGANALDFHAVSRIFAAKQRPHFDPLIVHLANPEEIHTVVGDVPEMARHLMQRFWPGPLTLVLPKRDIVPDLVTAGLPGVAVRVPDHPQARELIRRSGVPVAAPSANPFGRISPTTAGHVLQHLSEQIDMVVDGGPCRVGVESTVLRIAPEGPPWLLRPGGLSREAIEAEIGPVLTPGGSNDDAGPQTSPGQLLKHYAPRKRLIIIRDWSEATCLASSGALTLQPLPERDNLKKYAFAKVEVLTQDGNLNVAAANFFAALRQLDDAVEVDTIFACPFPDHGLGRALNDRLTRAAR